MRQLRILNSKKQFLAVARMTQERQWVLEGPNEALNRLLEERLKEIGAGTVRRRWGYEEMTPKGRVYVTIARPVSPEDDDYLEAVAENLMRTRYEGKRLVVLVEGHAENSS